MNHFDTSSFASPSFVRSRRAYLWECAFEYFVSLLVTDAFLTKLLLSIGLSDAACGIIASFISLAFLFQLFSVLVVRRVTNTKRFAILFHTLSQLFFMSLYLIPFLPFAASVKKVTVVICLLVAYFGNYFVTSVIYRWANSFVEPSRRARYSAGKEMLSLATGMVVTLVIGYAMDTFEAAGNLSGGFLFAAASILIFSACDLVCLLLIRKEILPQKSATEVQTVTLREVLRGTLGNRNFVHIVILYALWESARYATVGFLGTYRLKDLLFSVGLVQVINMVANLGRFALSRPFGMFSDKHSYIRGIELAMLVGLCGFAASMCTTPATRWLMVLHCLLYSVSQAGTASNFLNITYSYVDSRYFAEASAIKNSIAGLCGFGMTLLSSRLLAYVQSHDNMLFGIHMYGQQWLSLISILLLVIALVFAHTVVEKQKIMVQ